MSDRFNILHQLTGDSFNPMESRTYRLAVSLHPASFSCAVLSPALSSYLTLHHFTWETGSADPSAMPDGFEDEFLSGILRMVPWLNNPFLETVVAWEGAAATLIPGELYLEEHRESYLRITWADDPSCQVFSDSVEPPGARHVYRVPGAMMAAINDLFRGANLIHAGTVLINAVHKAYHNRIDRPHLIINLRSRFFDMMVYDGKTMTYYNTFSFVAPEDVVYYIIFVMEQLILNPDEVPLILYGNISGRDDLYTLLYKYIRTIDFGVTTGGGCCPLTSGQVEPHAYFSLFNLYPCAL